MNLYWQRRLIYAAALAIAVYGAIEMADGSFQFSGFIVGLSVAFIAHRIFALPIDALVVGLALIGYIVGNRGFAQQSLFAGLPILPAEFALAVSGTWMLVNAAINRESPLHRDALNYSIMLWLVLGAARVSFDIPRFHFLALRDFAMVYYAGFFFVGQTLARNARVNAFLHRCLTIGIFLLTPVFLLFDQFPAFFLRTLTRNNSPLIYIKSDVAVPLLAAGVFYFHLRPGEKDYWRYWAAGLVLLLIVGYSNSRAALMGLVAADVWLLAARRPKIPLTHVICLVCAALSLFSIAYSSKSRWAESQVQAAYERVLSIVDFSGHQQYQSGMTGDKGDNNRFRLVWWRTVTEETLATNPAFGLGFGYNLAARFLVTYEQDLGEDFTARSPHSIIFSTFGRMGLFGLSSLLAIMLIIARLTWKALLGSNDRAVAYWCMVWVIFVSSCFGVVLEGPMGAVPFWIIVGLAHFESAQLTASIALPSPEPTHQFTAPLQDGLGRV